MVQQSDAIGLVPLESNTFKNSPDVPDCSIQQRSCPWEENLQIAKVLLNKSMMAREILEIIPHGTHGPGQVPDGMTEPGKGPRWHARTYHSETLTYGMRNRVLMFHVWVSKQH